MTIRLIKNEIIRILGNYRMWLMILAMAALNVCILLVYFSVDDINPKEYRETKAQMAEQPDIIMGRYYDMGKYYDDETGSSALKMLYDEYMSTETYQEYLLQVQDGIDTGRKVSIFLTKFSQNNFDRTEKDYAEMKDSTPVFVGGYGIESAVSFFGSDVVIFLIIIITINMLFMQDKKSGMTDLTRAAGYGGGRLVFAKTISVFLYVALFSVIVYVSDILLAVVMYGTVDFAAPVQSLMSYAETAIQLNIGEFLVSAFLIRLLMYIAISSVVILLSIIATNEIFLYVGAAAFGALEAGIYAVGKAVRIAPLYHMSIAHTMNTAEFFGYYNYNLFTQPVSDTIVDVMALVIMTVIFIWTGIFIYSRSSLEYRSVSFYRRKKKSRRLYGLCSIEIQKFIFGYKIIFIILAVIILQAVVYVKKDARWIESDMYYRNYMKLLEGEVTDEKKQFIEDEMAKMEEAKAEEAELNEMLNEGKVSQEYFDWRINEIDKILFREGTIIKCRDYITYIEGLDVDDAELVYDRGWNYIFGGDDYERDINNAFIMVLAVILGAAFMYAEEYKYRMNVLIDISADRKKSRHMRDFIMFLYIVFLYLAVYLTELIWVNNEFGLSLGHANVLSLMDLSELKINTCIWGYYGLVTLVRFLTICVIVLIIKFICSRTKNTNQVIIISLILFLAPLLLNMLGIDAFDRYTANWLLSGNMFLQSVCH